MNLTVYEVNYVAAQRRQLFQVTTIWYICCTYIVEYILRENRAAKKSNTSLNSYVTSRSLH